jgi:apolipoprotein D and lipocalin family protein
MFKATNTLMTIGVMTLALLNSVQAGFAWGWCPELNTKSPFDLNQYLGVWHEQVRDKSILYEYGECIQAGYSRRDDGLINVHNSQLNGFSNTIDGVKGTAECKGSKCKVGFFLFRNGDYQIMETDYTGYAVVYSCKSYLFFRYETAWALTRATNPSASVVSTYEQVIRDKIPFYSFDNFRKTQQGGNCRYEQ